MSSPATAPAAPPPGPLATIANIFVDPAAAVKGIPRDYSWVWPLLIAAIVASTISYLSVPTVIRVMQTSPPQGMSPEQLQKSIGTIELTYKIMAFVTPVIIAAMLAILSGVLMLACTMSGILTSFRNLFSLLAHCGLIGMLQMIAGFVVIRLKGDDIQTMQELQPSFGLGLLFREGIGKQLLAVLDYFSVFTLWYIAILVIALAALTGASKTKAFFVSIPVWLIPMLLAVGGAMLRR